MSTYSFGTGIDLNHSAGPRYWLWDEMPPDKQKTQKGEIAYCNDHFIASRAPYFHPKAVEIFERHDFIWAGKWNHYDTMHFEYRPELINSVRVDCAADSRSSQLKIYRASLIDSGTEKFPAASAIDILAAPADMDHNH
jgi:hypothetical protein